MTDKLDNTAASGFSAGKACSYAPSRSDAGRVEMGYMDRDNRIKRNLPSCNSRQYRFFDSVKRAQQVVKLLLSCILHCTVISDFVYMLQRSSEP
jgi:hypothetical protein